MLLHITERVAWEAAQEAGTYRPSSLEKEGFIHCSTPEQLLGPANEFYLGQQGLVLLVIEPARVGVPLVYEDCYQSGQQFPHLYGPLDPRAVVQVLPFPPQPDGTFLLPDALRGGK